MEKQNNLKELTKAIREGNVVPERSREYWIPEERTELENRYRSGEGISEIALQLQRSEMAVIQQLVVAGLMTSPHTSRPRKSKQPRCRCSDCTFNPSKCEKNCYCLMEGTYA